MNKNTKSLKDLLIYNIKYYRYLNGYSQEKLAELCNLSSRYLTDVERGKHCPTIDIIEDIAKALNVKPYILFQEIDRDINIVKRIKSSRQYNQKIINLYFHII